jgi:prevent-host-death family protein
MPISEVSNSLSELVNEINRTKTRILMEESGVPVAALVPVSDLERLQQRDRDREEHFKAIERFGAAFADVPPEEAEAEIARIIAEIRAEDDAKAERQSA